MSGQRRLTVILTIYLVAVPQSALPVLTAQASTPQNAGAVEAGSQDGSRPERVKPQWSHALEQVKQRLLQQLESGAVPAPSVPRQAAQGPEMLGGAASAAEALLSHSFVYDAKGNLIERLDANGNSVRQTYDELDRLVRIDYQNGSFVKYTYDANGNRASMTDSTGTTEYEYDDLDRQTKITYPDGNWLDIEYDLLSRISRLWYVDGTDVRFTYYKDGRVHTIDRDGAVTSFTYDGAGRMESKTFANGCKTLYGYDAFGRLARIRHEDPGAGLISQFDYTLDKYGNRTQIVKTTPGGSMAAQALKPTEEVVLQAEEHQPSLREASKGSSPSDVPLKPARLGLSSDTPRREVAAVNQTMTATYDAMDRLTQVAYPDGRVATYTFDDFNNRTSKTEVNGPTTTVTTYEYDSNNRLMLTRINGNVDEEFTYDGNGNMTARKRFGHITYYEWDDENRLKAVIKPSGERVEYSYNGEGKLWQRKVTYLVGARTTNFYTTDSSDMPMILNEVTLETGRIAAHVYAGDTLIESQLSGSSSAYAAYLTGEYNATSITELRDGAGNPMWSLDYPDVYGSGSPNVIVGALAPGYIGEFYDTDAHLQFLRARWYDPTLGNFISQDSIDGKPHEPYGFLNRYHYASRNPLSRLDRTGSADNLLEKLFGRPLDWVGDFFGLNWVGTSISGGMRGMPPGSLGPRSVLPVNWFDWWSKQHDIEYWEATSQGKSTLGADAKVFFGVALEGVVRMTPGGGILLSGLDKLGMRKYGEYKPGKYQTSVSPYGEWRAAPGGVRLNKSATAYLDIGDIVGATYDPDSGQIVLHGKKSTAQLPGMRMDDLAMAIRMVFDHGVAPEVSLDPVPGEPQHHKWRYGPPDRPYLMDDTHLGWVMKEADRVLKYLSLGRKPWSINETLPAGFISGYRSYVDHLGDYPCSSGNQRFWIHPDEIVIDESPDGGAVKFVYASMMCSTEEVAAARSSSGPVVGDANRDGKVTPDDLAWVKTQLRRPVTANNYRADVDSNGVINRGDMALVRRNMGSTVTGPEAAALSANPAADDFVAWFNTHWQELRNYDFTPNDPTDPNIFQELEGLAKVYGVVKWIKDNNIPFDTSWVSTYDVYYTANDTPLYNDVMNVTGPCQGDPGGVIVTGGVSLCKDLIIDGIRVPPPVLSERPSEATMGWTFVDPRDGQTYNAAGISVARRHKDGVSSRTETDLSVDGRAGKVELTRTYNGFDAAYYPSRWTWEPSMVRPKGRGIHQIECDAVVAFAPAGVYLAETERSTEFRFAGTYCSHLGAGACPAPPDPADVDPQEIMSYFGSFDPARDVMTYFDAGLLDDPHFFFKDGTIYADFPSLASGDREGPRSGWLFKNRANDRWMFFDPDGKLLWIKDAHGNRTDYGRDGSGRLTSISDGTALITLTYSAGRATSASASNGTSVGYSYYPSGHLQSAQLDTGQFIEYCYRLDDITGQCLDDSDSLLREVRDENSVPLVGTTNDVYGRADSTELLGFTNPFNKDFNLDARTTDESGPLGDWATQYNENYLPTRVVDPLRHEAEMVWNDYKLLITRIEGKGTPAERRTDYFYYSYGDLLAVRRPNGEVAITLRNADGRPETTFLLDPCTAFLDGNFDAQHIYTGAAGGLLECICINPSELYRHTYTSEGKLARRSACQLDCDELCVPWFDLETFTYDDQGRMTTSTDGEGHTLTYSYDGSLGRISQITNDLGEYVDYAYDSRDRLQTVTNGILPVHYEYDARDRVSAVVQGEPGGYGADPGVRHRTEYDFDDVYGILLSVKSPNEVVTAYTYNSRKLLWKITHAGRQIYEYEYDEAGRVTRIQFQGTAGGALMLEKGWFYDADATSFIDESDVDWFTTAWMKDANDLTIQYPPTARFGLTYDYDLDGFVGPDDLSFFSTGWRRSSSDPAIVSPPVALAY